MLLQQLDEDEEARVPGQPYRVAVTRTLEYWPDGTRERVIHEEVVLAQDLCDLNLVARQLTRIHGGDGYSIRRLEEGIEGEDP